MPIVDKSPEEAMYKITDNSGWYILWVREWEGARNWKEIRTSLDIESLEQTIQDDLEFRAMLKRRDQHSLYYDKNGKRIT